MQDFGLRFFILLSWPSPSSITWKQLSDIVAFCLHLCPEMHLTLNLGTSYKTGLFVVFIVWQNYVCFSEN